jgi:hypothetical protein
MAGADKVPELIQVMKGVSSLAGDKMLGGRGLAMGQAGVL